MGIVVVVAAMGARWWGREWLEGPLCAPYLDEEHLPRRLWRHGWLALLLETAAGSYAVLVLLGPDEVELTELVLLPLVVLAVATLSYAIAWAAGARAWTEAVSRWWDRVEAGSRSR